MDHIGLSHAVVVITCHFVLDFASHLSHFCSLCNCPKFMQSYPKTYSIFYHMVFASVTSNASDEQKFFFIPVQGTSTISYSIYYLTSQENRTCTSTSTISTAVLVCVLRNMQYDGPRRRSRSEEFYFSKSS